MKFVLLCIIFISVAAIAILNLSYYRSKRRIFMELLDFLKLYSADVSFSKDCLADIIARVKGKYSKTTQVLLESYSNIPAYPMMLTDVEKSEISHIFAGMGRGDVEAELQYINNATAKVELIIDELNSSYATKGELRSKLIFIFGVILILILL